MEHLYQSVIYYWEKLKEGFLFKSTVSILSCSLSWLFGKVDDAVMALFALMVLDFLLGLYVAYRSHEVSSGRMREGAVKFLLYFLLIIAGNCMDRTFSYIPILAWLGLTKVRYLAVSYLAATEGISVLEHLSKLGVPVPKKVFERLASYKNAMEDEK